MLGYVFILLTALELLSTVVGLSLSSSVALHRLAARPLSAGLVHMPAAAFKLSYKLWHWQHQPLCCFFLVLKLQPLLLGRPYQFAVYIRHKVGHK